MKYHDNEVFVNLYRSHDLRIVGGRYTVNDFSVTPGQDPDGNIHAGLEKQFGGDGKMSFRVGRKGSDTTAKWFNDRIPADRTTFDHQAGKLNFAFIGTLELTLTGGPLGTKWERFVFNDIGIAQGHAGASNNWWFGGTHCSHIGDDRVLANGATTNGVKVSFKFRRGGNNVNSIDVDASDFIDKATWMSQIRDTTTLNQLVIPGSHDAGMSELHHCAPPALAGVYIQTQSGSIKQQLLDGSRYFDIRVDYDHDELVTYHRDGRWGCNGQSLNAVLDEMKEFLNTYRTESIIVKFSHIRNTDGHDAAKTKTKIDQLLDLYKANIYVDSQPSVDLAMLQLNDVRGKMILVFDYDEHISPKNGRFRYRDGPSARSGANLVVYDKYSDTADYSKMCADQVEKWNTHGGLGQDFMFLLSWTLTPKPPGSGVEALAKEANRRLPGVMDQQINAHRQGKPNIVYIDYLDAASTLTIIWYNF